MRRTTALIPYREPGKSRLAGHGGPPDGLDLTARMLLGRAMLADVVAALESAGVADLVVAAGDPAAARVARRLGVRAIPDATPDAGLNAAVDAAAGSLTADAVLVIAADLPTLLPEDVTAMAAAGSEVAVAPTERGGTGGLLRRPPVVIPAGYGPSSAQRHVDAARRAGLSVEVVELAGFHRDVDTLEDLAALPRDRLGLATERVIDRLDLT